ncbi:uncharacterized protein ACVW00_001443 [Marmoricola sp. URHA0025 HA25]
MTARVLVVAKAPVPGLAKTRLAASIGPEAAADLAAAALLDTIAACVTAFGDRCHIALTGDLARARRGEEIRQALSSWDVFAQRGATFADRLVHAHRTVAQSGQGPVVQIGMDTPQVTADLLALAAAQIVPGCGALGPAADGGWWLLGLDDAQSAGVLVGVPMSTGDTCRATRAAFAAAGVALALQSTLHDVDTLADVELVAAEAPETRFARTWARHAGAVA